MIRRRRGFTMITILWVMTVASIVSVAGALAGRQSVNATRNRVQMERALWIALGCARRTQAAIDDALREPRTLDEVALAWRMLERRVVLPSPPCETHLEAAGTRLDVNTATEEMAASLLRGLGEGDENAAAMAAALADWQDADDIERPSGAERGWYQSVVRAAPRNAPLADVRELALVRGFEALPALDDVFTAEPGRISLAHAPASVLLSVPGFTRETSELIASLADAGTPVRDASAVVGRVSRESAEAIASRYPEIVRVTTADPDAWLLDVRVANGEPPTAVKLRWRVIRSGRRCVVVNSRTMQ